MNQYVGAYSHAPQTWEVSVKDGKLFVKFDGKDYALTKSGDRKFTFGAQNENELVFVPARTEKSTSFSPNYTARNASNGDCQKKGAKGVTEFLFAFCASL